MDSAKIIVQEKNVAEISRGLLVFLGIESQDNRRDADYILEKTLNLRIFEDVTGKMNVSLMEENAAILLVSQFTILGDCRKGRRPSFTAAAKPEEALDLYNYFFFKVQERNVPITRGIFQAAMKVILVNNGPVTIIVDSKKQY